MKPSPARSLLALAVAAMGVVDLLSALLSRPPERLVALRHLVPTDVLDTSRTFTLLAGVLLVLTASGLRRGKRRAYVTAMFLCALSVPVNLLKAFDFEEATTAAALMFLLGINATAFAVKSRGLSAKALRGPALAAVLGLAVYAVGGCWLLEALYSPRDASLRRAMGEAVYQLFGVGEPSLVVERSQHVVRWYLGSIGLTSITLLSLLVIALLRPARHLGRHRAEVQRVRELLRQYGDNTVSAFALADDVDYFFSATQRAVIAYRFESDTLLAIGDPLGPPEEIPPLLEAFERYCREHDWQFGIYQARPEHLSWYRTRGWRAVHIGEDPVLRLDRFTLEGPALGTVRRAVRKLERQGLVARLFVPGTNAFDPGRDPDGLLAQLREISHDWLKGRAGGEKNFCMGRFDPARLHEVWLAVAWNPALRRVEAFCTWTPIWARRGWAIDLMRRRAAAPTGVMEFLVVKCAEHGQARGDALLSLSLSALVKVDPATGSREDQPVDDPARAFLIERLQRFYDFEGLFRWKRKFAPAFEDRFLVFPDALALPRVALALVRAQSQGGLLSYLRRDELPGPRLAPPEAAA